MLWLLLACASRNPETGAPVTPPPAPPARLHALPPALLHRVAQAGDLIGGVPLGGPGLTRDKMDGTTVLAGEWLISHFERSKAAAWRTRLGPDLVPIETAAIDTSALEGGYIFCAASVTPWGSHLGSEEYEPDAAMVGPDGALVKTAERGRGPTEEVPDYGFSTGGFSSPYAVGWIWELSTPTAAASPRRALGRFSHELGVVLADQRTVYLSDDTYPADDKVAPAGGGGLYRFVADRPGDLSAGELFAARIEGAVVSWVSLGHASEAELQGNPRFDELLERVIATPCPAGFDRALTWTGEECLKVRPGQEARASRFEARRYAAMKGASTGFTKTEGLAVGEGVLYLAVSSVLPPMSGLVAGLPDRAGGAILAFPLDADGVARSVRVEVADTIENPDNIAYVPGHGLFIAEDTDARPEGRSNLWRWDGQRLHLLLESPPEHELAGLNPVTVHGQGYLSLVYQSGKGLSTVNLIGPLEAWNLR
jgi:hypothetical protein